MAHGHRWTFVLSSEMSVGIYEAIPEFGAT
jgi:hypothetical protein